MSSDEDFSLVMEPSPLEEIKDLINTYKKTHAQLLEDQKQLAASRDQRRELAEAFKKRTVKVNQELEEERRSNKEQIDKEKEKLGALMQNEAELMEEIQKVEAELKEEEATCRFLKQQADVFRAVPERPVVFTGLTASPTNASTFEMESRIEYPMDGGTALITFEEQVVAKKVLDMWEHRVDLGGDCSISVKAKPVHLMLPRLVEIDSEVCPQRILISNLPRMNPDTLVDKLEIHFSKKKNGGGEVEQCELLPDSGTVVLTFVEENVAEGLTCTEYHEVKLQEKKNHRVRVTPFLNGKITNLKTEMTPCPRTVQLTGIPDVMERETLQDMLEIHFQKTANGGGEVEAIVYNPLGQNTTALFDNVPPNEEDD